jgi:hypothetical protein
MRKTHEKKDNIGHFGRGRHRLNLTGWAACSNLLIQDSILIMVQQCGGCIED